jgi:serine/threonine protein kinase
MNETSPPPMPAPDDFLIGQTVGGSYVITRLLGEGGMGKVYEAKHLRLPRLAAVKVLQPDLAKAGDAFERFQREAEVASGLGSRHIVTVFDFGTLPNGAPYMLMEFLQGKDLATLLFEKGKLAPIEVLRWLEQAVAGVSAAHEQNVIHRDLKPANLFIARDGDGTQVLKVVDFGLSKVRGISRSLTGLNVVGTPAYMSPEQIRSSATADKRADVYALGVILFELLTGRMPFEHDHVGVLMEQISSQPPPSLRAFAPELTEGLDRVVARALQKKPEDRYQTCFEFWSEAKRALREAAALGDEAEEGEATGQGVTDQPARRLRPVPATAISSPKTQTHAPRRTRLIAIVSVAGVVLLAILFGVALHLRAPAAPIPVESVSVPVPAPVPAPPSTLASPPLPPTSPSLPAPVRKPAAEEVPTAHAAPAAEAHPHPKKKPHAPAKAAGHKADPGLLPL